MKTFLVALVVVPVLLIGISTLNSFLIESLGKDKALLIMVAEIIGTMWLMMHYGWTSSRSAESRALIESDEKILSSKRFDSGSDDAQD